MSQDPAPSNSLISFRAENLTSFRDELTLTFFATPLAERGAVRSVPIAASRPVRLLPVSAIYGANASGKSNVLKAINLMRLIVEQSFRGFSPGMLIPRQPFKLDRESSSRPTLLEVDLVIRGIRHNYGFEYDDKHILKEWAVHYPKGHPAMLFRREQDDVAFGPTLRAQGSRVAPLLRPNALFLSTAAATNFKALSPLYVWFETNLRLAQEANRHPRQMVTIDALEFPGVGERVRELIRAADLGIVNIERQDPPPIDEEVLQRMLPAVHEGGNGLTGNAETIQKLMRTLLPMRVTHHGSQGEVVFEEFEESLGTLIWIGLLGQVVRSLSMGLTLLADELDGSLHPTLVEHLVQLFQDPESNPRGAQLVFTTHDTSLLGDSSDRRVIGRDQVWFTEKDVDGRSRLYPLADFSPRKEEAIGRRYLAGRYGGIPILSRGDFSAISSQIEAPSDEF